MSHTVRAVGALVLAVLLAAIVFTFATFAIAENSSEAENNMIASHSY